MNKDSGIQKDNETLIDGLYMKLKGKKLGISNREHMIDLVFPLMKANENEGFYRPDKYKKESQNDFHCCSNYILDENALLTDDIKDTSERVRKNAIEEFIKTCIKKSYLEGLKADLIELLNKTNIHTEQFIKDKLINKINQLSIINYISNEREQRCLSEWVDIVYYYFYYAVTDKMHINLSFSIYPKLEEDIYEYNNQVTLMYGVSGNPGMYKLYSLAERDNPNIIALYECGELEYYGKGPTNQISFNNAYRFYERTKECYFEHPLATWSIAYMKFAYSQEKAKEKPCYRVDEFERQIKNGKKNMEWYDSILFNAMSSYSHGCSAAANLLGKILDAKEEVFPRSRLGSLGRLSSKELFKESADAGYVYGCNNYAIKCLQEADKASKDKKIQLTKEAFKYLDKSAEMGNPWAINKVAVDYYYKGCVIEGEVIVEQDFEKSASLFKKAGHMAIAEDYYWPVINLVDKFFLDEKMKERYCTNEDITPYLDILNCALCKVEDKNQKDAINCLLDKCKFTVEK